MRRRNVVAPFPACRSGRRWRAWVALPLATFLLPLLAGTICASAADRFLRPTVGPAEFARYAERFVRPDGRVVDPQNGGVSHSEGQGYGMLLAARAGEREAFERIWSFTRERLQIRHDALFAWRWDPRSDPHVTDPNNASDGDVLIAHALLEGAARWNVRGYLAAADAIIVDIGRKLVITHEKRTVLRPATYGFDGIAGNHGPVLNPSYWIYEAFALFETVRPEFPWAELARGGMAITATAQRSNGRLVPDWVRYSGGLARPARGFDPHFSYDAVRVPLYLAAAGARSRRLMRSFDEVWNVEGAGAPVAVDVRTGRALHAMKDPGYRMIAALAGCVARARPVPEELTVFRPTTYFASTLHLLALSAVRTHHPGCIEARPVEAASSPPRRRVAPAPRRPFRGGVLTASGMRVPAWVAGRLAR